MATITAVAKAVGLIYASHARQPDQLILEAYRLALEDASDYQLECATRRELKTPGTYPISAGELRSLALQFRRSEQEPERLAPPRGERWGSDTRAALREAVAELLPDWDLSQAACQKPPRKYRQAAKTGEQLKDEVRRATR